MSDLLEVECRCGVKVMSSPFSTIEALCMTCRGRDWDVVPGAAVPIGEWHPTVGYPSPGQGALVLAVTREPFPAPNIISRIEDSWPLIAPRPVVTLAEFAREHSWEVRSQYSQGNMPHAITGRPGALKDLIALRFGAHPMTDRQAYAVYSRSATITGLARHTGTWTWTSFMIWGPDLMPSKIFDLAALKAYLMMAPDSGADALADWARDLRSIEENRKALAKRTAAARPAKPKEVG